MGSLVILNSIAQPFFPSSLIWETPNTPAKEIMLSVQKLGAHWQSASFLGMTP